MSNLSDNYDNENPLFFLFTCVKNGRPYIEKLFGSLLRQTKVNFIHYIYEDGSEEPLDEMVEAYKEKVSRLSTPYKVVYEKNPVNIGLNKSTQHCISMCNLPYFIWVDCDNWIGETFFEELEKTALQNPDAIYIRTNRYDVKNGKQSRYYKSRRIIRKVSRRHQDGSFLAQCFMYSFFAVKRDLYYEVNPDNYFVDSRDVYNDVQVISHCLFSGRDFAFCENAYSYYLFVENSEGNRPMDKYDKVRHNMTGIKELAYHDNWKDKECIDVIYKILVTNLQIKDAFEEGGYSKCVPLIKEKKELLKDPRIPKINRRFFRKQQLVWYMEHRSALLIKMMKKVRSIAG